MSDDREALRAKANALAAYMSDQGNGGRSGNPDVADEIMELFCKYHGFKRTTKLIRAHTLANRMQHGGWQPVDFDTFPYLDHTWYFKKDRRAAAVVTFPYRVNWKEMRKFAEEKKLIVQELDWANWYYPGRCEKIIWTPARSIEQIETEGRTPAPTKRIYW